MGKRLVSPKLCRFRRGRIANPRNGVESYGGAILGGVERYGSMPHIRREQHQPSDLRLYGAAHWIAEANLEAGLAELDRQVYSYTSR